MFTLNYYIYKVQPNDRLESIAKKAGISVEDLQNFNNKNTRKFGSYLNNNLYLFTELLIPINYKTPNDVQEELKANLPQKDLSPSFYKDSYIINERIVVKKKNEVESEYTLHVKHRKEDRKNIVDLYKKQGDKKDLSNKIQEIALWNFQRIFPISFLLNEEGFPVAIHNGKLFIEKIKIDRIKIEEFYKSDLVTSYLNKFDEILASEKSIYNKLFSFALYKALFPRLKWFQKNNVFSVYFPILPDTNPICFSCKATYVKVNATTTCFMIKGESTSSKSLKNILMNENEEAITDAVKSELTLAYVIDNATKQLQKCKLKITTFNEDAEYSTYHLLIK